MSSLEEMLQSLERARQHSERKTVNKNLSADNDPLHDLLDNTITKIHALSRAYYRLGLIEKRCMEALISKLHPLRGDNNLQELELSALEYAKTYQVSEKHAYRDIASAVEALMHRVIRADRTEGKKGKVEMTVMTFAEYKTDEGKIVCEFNPRIVPHLIGLREKFSSYPLKKAVNFSSSYSWRFYELLVSWAQPKSQNDGRFMGWIDRKNVDELRGMLGVPVSYRWADFQKQVLDMAQSELLEKANIHLDIQRIKTSRKITHLNIKFIENDQQPLPLKSNDGRKGKN